MAVNDIIEVVFRSRYGSQVGLNVRHYLVAGQTGTGATLGQLADYFAGLVDAEYAAVMTDQAEFEGASAQKIFPLPKSASVGSTIAAVTGTLAGDPIPRQVAGLVRFRTALAGPAQRGRMYIPFPSEGVNEATDLPSIAYVNAVTTLAALISAGHTVGTPPNTSSLALIIWHRETNTWDLVTMYGVAQLWATQRRRGDFGRPNPESGMGGLVPIS